MSIHAGVAYSNNPDAYHAGFEAAAKAIQNAGISEPHLVILFSSVAFDQEQVVKGARDGSGHAPLVGCSTAGEITNAGPHTKTVAAMAIQAEGVQFTPAKGAPVSDGAREAGAALARELKSAAPDMRAMMIFPDVLTGNGADVVRGIQDELGEHFPIMGGAAGDDFEFKQTYEYLGDEVHSGAVVGAGLSGNFVIGAGVRHGWMPIGVPMKVTRSNGATVYTIDDKPAISIYEDYFGESAGEMRREPLAKLAITYPLGLKVPELDEYLIRDPVTVGEDGSITCAAEIPEGSEVRLMIGSRERAVEAAQQAARKFMADFEAAGTKPDLVLVFNCIAREKLFGQKAHDEIHAVQEIIGPNVPMLGFYTYGEQAPIGGETRDTEKIRTRFYNETLVLFGIGHS